MDLITLQTTQTQYTNALTFGPSNYVAISIQIWNQSVYGQLWQLGSDGHFQNGQWSDEIVFSAGSSLNLAHCGGVRFRTGPAGAAAIINGWAWREADPQFTAAQSLPGTITPSGVVIPFSLETTDGVVDVVPTTKLFIGSGLVLTNPVAGEARLVSTSGNAVLFNDPNTTLPSRYLTVKANTDIPGDDAGIHLESASDFDIVSSGNFDAVSSDAITLQSANDLVLTAHLAAAAMFFASAGAHIDLGNGKTFQVRDHLGNPIMQLTG